MALCEALLDLGASPNERATPDSRFPLLIAAAGGRRAVLELLLQRGAEVDATMGDYQCARRSSLLAAAAGGQVEMVALLCTAGADVNRFVLRDGSTALALAAARGSLPTVRILLASGALVNKACHDAYKKAKKEYKKHDLRVPEIDLIPYP
jgi:ankyrin repeat protein